MSARALPGAAFALQPRLSGLTHVGVAGTVLAASGGAGCALGLLAAGVPFDALDLIICAAPALVTAALGTTSQQDRNQYVARVLAAAMMLPMLLMMWAVSHDLQAPGWVEAVAAFGFILLHGLGFAALVWRLAASTTRIEAMPGTGAVAADVLGARLSALLSSDLPWRLSRGAAAHEWQLDCQLPNEEERFHRVLLNVDDARREVQVRERLGANGAAPQDAEEADMRSLGDDAFDTTRPQAQKVWSRTFQTTMIRPERLARVRLNMTGRQAHAEAAPWGDDGNAEAMLTLLAALATRSGYAWQPVITLRS